ncbi:phage major capsid protein [Mesorhizobium sp. M0129]|uniref:phage major capsid protein n=1 Tax=Mesorhizobium sp. M0129 TaxID=2956886 RepID=UPI0033379128
MDMEKLVLETKFTADPTGAIEGIAWDFSSPDRVGDMIEPTAFVGLTGKSIPALFAHDQSQVVGVFDSITVEADGLHVKGKLLIDTVERAREVRSMIQANAVRGLSIGYLTRKAAPRRGGGRTIQSLELLEISIVAVPANPNARITSQKDFPLTTENTNPTAELETKLAAAETKITAAETKAAEAVAALKARLDGMETRLNRPAIIKGANDNEPSIERKAFKSFLKYGPERMPGEETKSLVISDDTRGGYLAPAEFQAEVIKNIVQFSPVRQAARVGATASSSVILPKRTGTPTASWVGETETRQSTESAYGQIEIPVNEAACYVDVSLQLLEDAAVNVESEVAMDLAEEFGRLEAVAFVNGDGFKKPTGFMTDAGIPFTVSGSAATIADADGTADGLINLMYALKPAYRANGVWMANGTTIAYLRKLKDTTKQYIWQQGVQAGEPSTLLGRPLVEAPDMPDVAAGTFPIIFGDFTRYRIYDRVAMSILRDPYSQATSGKVRFHARRRVGAANTQAEAFRKLKVSI